jgi:hypothetical protein
MNNDTIDIDVQKLFAQIGGDHGTCYSVRTGMISIVNLVKL